MTSRRIIVLLGVAIIIVASAAYMFVGTEEPVKKVDEMEYVTVESILSKSESESKLYEEIETAMQPATQEDPTGGSQDAYANQWQEDFQDHSETDMAGNWENSKEDEIAMENLTAEDYKIISDEISNTYGIEISPEEVEELIGVAMDANPDRILSLYLMKDQLFNSYPTEIEPAAEVTTSSAAKGE